MGLCSSITRVLAVAVYQGAMIEVMFVGKRGDPSAPTTHYLTSQNEEYYKRIPEATEDELDMLDLAFGLTDKYGHMIDQGEAVSFM